MFQLMSLQNRYGRQLCLALFAAGMILTASPAQADEPTRMALFSVTNTSDTTLNYYVRWGTSGSWKSWTVKPGETMLHWWEYDYAGKNRSPRPYIRFDADLTVGAQWDQRWAQAYAAPKAESDYAKRYVFVASGEVLDIKQA